MSVPIIVQKNKEELTPENLIENFPEFYVYDQSEDYLSLRDKGYNHVAIQQNRYTKKWILIECCSFSFGEPFTEHTCQFFNVSTIRSFAEGSAGLNSLTVAREERRFSDNNKFKPEWQH